MRKPKRCIVTQPEDDKTLDVYLGMSCVCIDVHNCTTWTRICLPIRDATRLRNSLDKHVAYLRANAKRRKKL